MGKGKLKRFAEMDTFPNVIQASIEDIEKNNFKLKGKWAEKMFGNTNPIVLELGCGKGEYTVGLSRLYPNKNFIGIDIKGARMWLGAKQSLDQSLKNVAFLRTRIEFIDTFFSENEISEIWITFPDPQLKERRSKKRLTGPVFLNKYKLFLEKEGIIHLKTDNDALHEYTLEVIKEEKYQLIDFTNNLYSDSEPENANRAEAKAFQTFYESQYLLNDKNITYIKFKFKNETI